MPVPDSATAWGLLVALSVKVSVPVTEPRIVAVNVTLTPHVLLGTSVAPQVVEETAKLALAVMLLMLSVPVPLFLSITLLAELVLLTTSLPKFSDVGESETALAPTYVADCIGLYR
jgi:hypothetical protein